MKIVKNKIRLELSPAEIETFGKMVTFTRKFFEVNNQCIKYKCSECPLSMFCGDDNSRTTQEAIEEIEDFLNGGI